MITISIQVPESDRSDLEMLAQGLPERDEVPTHTRPFDGVLMAQIVIPITTAAVPVIKKWLDVRIAARRSYQVYVDGVQFSGYTAKEVTRLIEALETAGGQNAEDS